SLKKKHLKEHSLGLKNKKVRKPNKKHIQFDCKREKIIVIQELSHIKKVIKWTLLLLVGLYF
ncbi:MAG: hypothetical protein KAQ95_07390, partial [Candidatus Heimdallarchaeota archaeon]|nr:hypothetical protein [Candidatus Heimdallarchaeota archaeon]